MNDATFTELVNLYFDREISSIEIEMLREELASCEVRKAEFEQRYRLHQAMRMAVAPEAEAALELRELVVRQTSRASRLTLWSLGTGVAACLSVGFLLLNPVIEESQGVATAGEMVGLNELDSVRFSQQSEANQSVRGSLTSHFRLMGLTPEMAPAVRELSRVDVEAQRQREVLRLREIERLNQYETYSAMLEPQLFDSLMGPASDSESPRWSAEVQPALMHY